MQPAARAKTTRAIPASLKKEMSGVSVDCHIALLQIVRS
jgi:hypothetical protein